MRAESYASPGALPDVRGGTPEQDLARRDFTVNAIAVALDRECRGQMRAAPGALEDLAARRLGCCTTPASRDDPTRILRLARYAVRLGFEVDPHTAELASTAIEGGALHSVSGERLGAELRLALAEPDPVAPLAELDRMGVLTAWQPGVSFDEHVARTALRILPSDGSLRVLLAGALMLELSWRLSEEDTEPTMRGFLHELELPAGEARRAFGVGVCATVVTDQIGGADTTADLLELMLGMPVESLALAAAIHDMETGPDSYGRRMIEEWLRDRRHITLGDQRRGSDRRRGARGPGGGGAPGRVLQAADRRTHRAWSRHRAASSARSEHMSVSRATMLEDGSCYGRRAAP